MEKIADIKPGDIFTNETLMNIFLCSSQGGMRKSNKTNTLVIVINQIKSIYEDRWEEDILLYTGMGAVGDQDFHRAQNKTLYYSGSNDISIHLFETWVKNQYVYIGKVALAKQPFYEDQPDVNGNMRKVCVFPIKLINGKKPIIKEGVLVENKILKRRRIKKLDDNSLLSLAKKGNTKPGTRNVIMTQYERNEAVAEYAKRIAKGICQLCGEKAPFLDKYGIPYLETHHIDWLSKGGEDTIENTAALCPNCHAKMHVVNDMKDRKYLKQLIKNIISDL